MAQKDQVLGRGKRILLLNLFNKNKTQEESGEITRSLDDTNFVENLIYIFICICIILCIMLTVIFLVKLYKKKYHPDPNDGEITVKH